MARFKIGLAVTVLLSLAMPSSPQADELCSKSKVISLAKEGSTIKSIATQCGMSPSQVKATLEEKTPASKPSAMPSGTPLQVCGCYGYVPFGYTEFAPMCESQTAIASPCPGMCAMGGSPWRRVCG